MREIVKQLKSWNIKVKYRCPECGKVMRLERGKYICEGCQLQVQFTMQF